MRYRKLTGHVFDYFLVHRGNKEIIDIHNSLPGVDYFNRKMKTFLHTKLRGHANVMFRGNVSEKYQSCCYD